MGTKFSAVKVADDALRVARRLSSKGFYASAVSFLRVAEREYRLAGLKLHSFAIQMELAAIRAEVEGESGQGLVEFTLILLFIVVIGMLLIGSGQNVYPSCVPNCGK